MNKIVLISLFAVLLNSCTVNKSISYKQINNSEWSLDYINGISEEENATFKTAFLKFSEYDSTYSGSNGCNFYNGKVIISNGLVNFGQRMETKRACKGINEQLFYSVLNSTNNMKIVDSALVLYNGELKLAQFKSKKE
jgi:heat shock protein HslJ